MLRLVHFAAETHLAGDMMGTLRGGMQPVMNRLPIVGTGRHDMAHHAAQGPAPDQARENQATTPQPNSNWSGHAAEQGAAPGGAQGGAGPGAGAGAAGGAAAGAAAAGVLLA